MSDWIFESVNEKVDGGYIEVKKNKYGKEIKDGKQKSKKKNLNYSSTLSSSDCHLK
jgi:hypothetical protein